VRARDCGFEVIYDGIRLTPAQIAAAAAKERAHVVGLSILSGSHVTLVEDVLTRLKSAGLGHVPVVVGGIIPAEDAARLEAAGVARVYTPKDFDLTQIMREILDVVEGAGGKAA
jgi:(2R)-ethylmalonyl-CoA mutase